MYNKETRGGGVSPKIKQNIMQTVKLQKYAKLSWIFQVFPQKKQTLFLLFLFKDFKINLICNEMYLVCSGNYLMKGNWCN